MEGAVFDDGTKLVDIGSRQKRKAYMKEHGLTDPSDYRPGWGERRHAEMDRHYDRRTSEAFKQATQMLYTKGKLPK